MQTTPMSHARDLPPCHGDNVRPLGLLPSDVMRLTSSLITED